MAAPSKNTICRTPSCALSPGTSLKHYTGLDIDNCIDLVCKTRKGKALGQGEQGITYILTDTKVIKVTELSKTNPESAWFSEAVLGQELGALKIAPTLYDYFVCNKYGFIIMERLTPLKGQTFRTATQRAAARDHEAIRLKIKTDGGIDVVDHVGRLSVATQKGFIAVFKTMIEHGYIHMDNHVDNLGYIAERPVVFDFGFTQKRSFRPEDYPVALAFSLFQMLEHCPRTEIADTWIFQVACACLTGQYDWTTGRISGSPGKKCPCPDDLDAAALWANAHFRPTGADLYVGCCAYVHLLNLERTDRYDPDEDRYYALIYKIRNPAGKYARDVNAFAKKYGFYKK